MTDELVSANIRAQAAVHAWRVGARILVSLTVDAGVKLGTVASVAVARVGAGRAIQARTVEAGIECVARGPRVSGWTYAHVRGLGRLACGSVQTRVAEAGVEGLAVASRVAGVADANVRVASEACIII